jgi:hypothetical protein
MDRPADRSYGSAVPNVVDLSLCAEARRALHRVLSERGLGFFVKPNPGSVLHLDSRRIAWVVEAARRRNRGSPSSRRAPRIPGGRLRDPNAVARTRRVLRRELIRRLAETLVGAGL